MQRGGGGAATPLPQVLSTLGHFTLEGEEEILNAGSLSSSDQVTSLALPSWIYERRFKVTTKLEAFVQDSMSGFLEAFGNLNLTPAEVVIDSDSETSDQVTSWSFRLVTMNTVH